MLLVVPIQWDNATLKTYRLITSLIYVAKFPALILAQDYHQRWEAESTLDELKVHMLPRKIYTRPKNSREVVQ
jgi:hypothetical protein